MKQQSLSEHIRALAEGEYSSVELTERMLSEITSKDPTLRAYCTVDPEGALAAARASDQRRREGRTQGLLDGIPYALKDNIAARGLPLTCASRILSGYLSPYDATVAARLRACGAVLLGKTNLDEFAMGSSTEHSIHGATRNPHAPGRAAGGSSGGSAAAVASGEAVFSLGSDTGGSVRQPAVFCGVAGLKPTRGLLSRYGLVAFSSSLDTVGVIAPCAKDTLLVLFSLWGRDPMDATTGDPPSIKSTNVLPPHLRVGVVTEGEQSEAVRRSVRLAAERLRERGASVTPITLPRAEEATAAYFVLTATEASSNLGRYDGVRYGHRAGAWELSSLYRESRGAGLGREVKRRILFGTDLLLGENRARYYLPALRVREEITEELNRLFGDYDLILTPTAPTVAFPLGADDERESYRADLWTVYASLAGLPALSVPMGSDDEGLPVGVQLMGAPRSEELLTEVGNAIEEVPR